MLKELKFVQGAVARKDFVPELTHFHIKDRMVKSFNGTLALCAPIDIGFDIKPKAVQFIKAIQSCKAEAVQLSITPTGRLSVKSGKFKALIECLDTNFPDVVPEGEWVPLDGIDILPALKKLSDYTGEDASRKWAMGILLRGRCAYATNNVILAEYDLGVDFPVEINIPAKAVAEIVRIGKEPRGIMVTPHNVTFMYDKDHWIKTQLYDLGWPDLSGLLGREAEYLPVDEEWFDAVETVAPFVNELSQVFFGENKITTDPDGGAGGTVELENFPYEGVYNHKYFLSLKGLITEIDLHAYPSPCLFRGPNVRGALMGMRR